MNAGLKGGDTVLVQGTGGVSIFGLQFAVASGATVIATSSSDAKLEQARKLGATHVINYKTTPDWEQEVLRLTNGEGAQHIIEVGGPGTVDKSLTCLRMGGYLHVIGVLGGVVRIISSDAKGSREPRRLTPISRNRMRKLRCR